MADLLFEIGLEEVPASFVGIGIASLEEGLGKRLGNARLGAAEIAVVGTPRRLVAFVTGLTPRQSDLSERVVGPPARVAFDGDGKPTKAALGFANKNGVDVSTLERSYVDGKKGEYAVCRRTEAGRDADAVLAELLPQILGDIPWPKSMRWGWRTEVFARPVHWLVAVLGSGVVEFEFLGVNSANTTFGHRFLAPGAIEVTADRRAYERALRAAFVIVDPVERKTVITAELSRVEADLEGSVRHDEELLDEVVNLVEYPVAISGGFDESFLEVPAEVIVSAMRSHQRYFAVERDDGSLANRFVTVAGTVVRDPKVVARGNERVLAARLADAKFFFDEDRKRDLDQWALGLSDVVYQRKLGTIGDKVARMQVLGANLAKWANAEPAKVKRTIELCKADLLTSMVFEFPDLQGTIGRHYAAASGVDLAIAKAIEEHYAPRGASDAPPTCDLGAVVAIADRVDTIVGGFAAGLAPTGSADAFGLRRAAVGIATIILDRDWSVDVGALVDVAAEQYSGRVEVTEDMRGLIRDFFRERVKRMFASSGLPVDCVAAALAAGDRDIPDARRRALAVAELRKRDDFEPLAAAFKRVANILKGSSSHGEPMADVFTEAEEKHLWDSFGEVRSRVTAHLSAADYGAALTVLAELKVPVDKFFDTVLVMDKDERVRQNRLALLGQINATFIKIADFRQLAV